MVTESNNVIKFVVLTVVVVKPAVCCDVNPYPANVENRVSS